jgi:hypothetical protein
MHFEEQVDSRWYLLSSSTRCCFFASQSYLRRFLRSTFSRWRERKRSTISRYKRRALEPIGRRTVVQAPKDGPPPGLSESRRTLPHPPAHIESGAPTPSHRSFLCLLPHAAELHVLARSLAASPCAPGSR